MKGIILTAPTLLLLLLSGCGKNHDAQTYSKAPKVISDELLASGLSKSDVANLMSENPQARVRVLNKNTFEFKGLEKRQILKAEPSAIVEKNKFMKIQAQNTLDTKTLFADAFNGDVTHEFAQKNCLLNTLLQVPEIEVSNLKLSESFHVGEGLKLSSKKENDLELTAWYIIPPMGSNIDTQFDDSPQITIKPDMPGSYIIALFFKKKGYCNIRRNDITVTSNPVFEPEMSKQDIIALNKISKQNFKHVTITNADRAQKLLTQKTKIVVAVLDTGVNYNHPALKRNMWINSEEISGDGIDNDSNGYIDDVVGFDFENDDGMPMDDQGHGSHVAGLVAGDFMGTGNMSNIKIMALKNGSLNGLDLGSLIKSIDYAVDNGADIINMSFGGTNKSEILKASIARANLKGVLIVAASGNGDHRGVGIDNDLHPAYPASYDLPNILAVGAAQADGSLTTYSNYGRTQVDIVAVGGHSNLFERRSNLLSSAYLPNPKNLLTQPMAGTSMASPVAAGIAALVMAEGPKLSPADVRTLLMDTGKKSPFLKDQILSESAIDAEKAILSLQNLF